MKVKFNRWYNAVLTAILSLLGYSCSFDEPEEYGPIIMYGTPHADYIIKGQVTDETGTSVKGIKTSLKQIYKTETETYIIGIDSVQTGVSGNYLLKYDGMQQTNIKLIVEDIDGETNGGEFLSDTIDINYDKAVQTTKGDNHWYSGTYEIAQDVKLKKK